MSAYPLQQLLAAQARRVGRALAALAEAQQQLRQRLDLLEQARQRLEQARQARQQLQRAQAQELSQGAASLTGARLGAPSLRMAWLLEQMQERDKARQEAADAVAQAQALLAQAREAHRRALAKQDALLAHQSAWRLQQDEQQLAIEEGAAEELLANRHLHRA